MATTSSLLRRHRWLLWVAVGMALLIVFVLWFFEPQALFLNDTASEAAPRLEEVAGSNEGSSRSPRGILAEGDSGHWLKTPRARRLS